MKYNTIVNDETIEKTMKALTQNGIEPLVVDTGSQALDKIKEFIPAGSSVMNGASKTLQQIGFVDYLKSDTHGWNNLHAAIVAEKDPKKQAILRKQSALSDYYLGSVHALAQNGEFIIASNTGSQLPHIVFTSPNLIFVVGAQKIVIDLAEGLKRLEEYVFPLEDERMKSIYGSGSMLSKILIFKRENTHMGRKVRMIIVKESLGF